MKLFAVSFLFILAVFFDWQVHCSSQGAKELEFTAGGKTFEEEVILDSDKKQEALFVKSKDGQEENIIINDFKRGIMGIISPKDNVCYIRSIPNTDSPFVEEDEVDKSINERFEQLSEEEKAKILALEEANNEGKDADETQAEVKEEELRRISDEPIEDKSVLPESMRALCADSDVYWVEKVEKTSTVPRVKRGSCKTISWVHVTCRRSWWRTYCSTKRYYSHVC